MLIRTWRHGTRDRRTPRPVKLSPASRPTHQFLKELKAHTVYCHTDHASLDSKPVAFFTRRQTNIHAKMPGVSVRDVPADKFIDAYAAFLKRQGKLPIPGS